MWAACREEIGGEGDSSQARNDGASLGALAGQKGGGVAYVQRDDLEGRFGTQVLFSVYNGEVFWLV